MDQSKNSSPPAIPSQVAQSPFTPPTTLERPPLPPDHTRGVIYYNRGTGCIARMIVSLESLRKHYHGKITLFLEGEHAPELVESFRKEFNCDIIFDNNPETTTYVRAVEICCRTPYDITIWMDADTLVLGPVDELFEAAADYDLAIVHFALWKSNGPMISGRIREYKAVVPDFIQPALDFGPAINCGVYAFRKDTPFLKEWNWLSKHGEKVKTWDKKKQRWNTGLFIPDEKACQVLLPRYKINMLPPKFNVSVIHDPGTQDIRVIHFHGRKHVFDVPFGYLWQAAFADCCERNLCNICHYTAQKYCNRRTGMWLRGEQSSAIGKSPETRTLLYRANRAIRKNCPEALQGPCEEVKSEDVRKELTVVTACDPKYVEHLRWTFPNWVKYKKITQYPILVFVNGIPLDDPKLQFLRDHKVTLIPWETGKDGAPVTDDHRELMLSAFVLGTARHVSTPHWIKLDADSFATSDQPLFKPDDRKHAFIGHRWGYSWEKHIRTLDEWAAKLTGADAQLLSKKGAMYPRGTASGRRFYHNTKRTISFVQVNSTEFTKLCARLANGRLPAPSQDTFMFYIADRAGFSVGTDNFKRHRGFDQGNALDGLIQRLAEVEGGVRKTKPEPVAPPVAPPAAAPAMSNVAVAPVAPAILRRLQTSAMSPNSPLMPPEARQWPAKPVKAVCPS